jgi:hypothetical protein
MEHKATFFFSWVVACWAKHFPINVFLLVTYHQGKKYPVGHVFFLSARSNALCSVNRTYSHQLFHSLLEASGDQRTEHLLLKPILVSVRGMSNMA